MIYLVEDRKFVSLSRSFISAPLQHLQDLQYKEEKRETSDNFVNISLTTLLSKPYQAFS